jgi:hypothetical protein
VVSTGFVRRVNRDSTTDSICLSCFKPVARAAAEFDLADEENLHTCEPLEQENMGQSTPNVGGHVRCDKES